MLVGFDVSPFLRGPAPYFPDWRWTYQFTNTLTKLWAPILSLTALMAFVSFAQTKEKQFVFHEKKYLLLLVFIAMLFQMSVIYYSRAGLGVFLHRIINPGINGYFTASLNIKNVGDFLSGYQSNLGHYPMYAKFHPPGSILIFWLIGQFVHFFSSQTNFSLNISFVHGDVKILWDSLLPFQKLTALMSGYLIVIFTALTIFPVYFLAKLLYSTKTAIRVSFLYVFIPSVTLFLPLNDTFFPFFSAFALYLLIKGVKEKRKIDMLFSGVILFIGAFFTLTILFLLSVFALIYLFYEWRSLFSKEYIHLGIFFILGFIVLPILLYFLFGFNSIAVVSTIMGYHRQVVSYRQNPLWLIYNFYDFFVFLGLPLLSVFFVMVWQTIINSFLKKPLDYLFVSFCIMTLILDFLGTTNGEVGRVWLPFIPLILPPLGNYLTDGLKFSQKQFLFFILLQGIQVILLQTFWVTVW